MAREVFSPEFHSRAHLSLLAPQVASEDSGYPHLLSHLRNEGGQEHGLTHFLGVNLAPLHTLKYWREADRLVAACGVITT